MKFYTLFLLSICFISQPLYAQEPKEFEIATINWHDMDEFDGDSIRKMAFYYSLTIDSPLDIQFANQIKILDIDGVAPLDLVYFSSDSLSFHVFINRNYTLQHVLHVVADLIEITRRSPLNPVKLITARFDSTAYEYIINSYASFIYEKDLKYALERTDILKQGIMDIYGNMPPSKFRVIMETPLVVGPGLKQLIKKLSLGETGYAAASVETKPGEHWWKVYIQEPDYQWRMGWLRRANVKILYTD